MSTISSLPEQTTAHATDYLPIIDESGTPTTKKITVNNLVGFFHGSGRTKTLANNAATAIFSIPLTTGETTLINLTINVVAKKGTDWAVAAATGYILLYNDGGVLQTTLDTSLADNSNNAGAVSLAAFGSLLTPIGVSLSSGVVTVTVNPGNVGTTPDSITLYYQPTLTTGQDITYL